MRVFAVFISISCLVGCATPDFSKNKKCEDYYSREYCEQVERYDPLADHSPNKHRRFEKIEQVGKEPTIIHKF